MINSFIFIYSLKTMESLWRINIINKIIYFGRHHIALPVRCKVTLVRCPRGCMPQRNREANCSSHN